MGENKVKTVSQAIHKIQLALLDGIKDDNHLFAAGSLLSKSDYNDVVTERSISKMCGYPLCSNALPLDPLKKGHYRVSLKEHKVYDLQETGLYCGSNCLIISKAYAGSLADERGGVLNADKVYGILRLFENVGVGSCEGGEEGSGAKAKAKAKLVIKNKEEVKGGDVSAVEWMGASNAIEGYVPHRDRRSNSDEKGTGPSSNKNVLRNEVDFEVAVNPNEKSTGGKKKVQKKDVKSTQLNASGSLEPLLSEMNFTSVIMMNDEYAVSKGKSDGGSKPAHSRGKEGWKPKKVDSKKGKDSIFGSMDFMSTIITDDEYSVSKLPPSQVMSDTDQMAQEFSENLGLGDPKKCFEYSKDSVVHAKNVSQSSMKLAVDGSTSAGSKGGEDASCSSGYLKDESRIFRSKSSLRTSGTHRSSRSVTWADEKLNGLTNENLCEFDEFKDTKEGPGTLGSKVVEDEEDSRRFASAEACAMALSQAAESVASGRSGATDAVFEAGITVLPQPEVENGEECPVEDVEMEERDTVKWPEKPDNLDSDTGDSNNLWFDAPPEGFSLALSPFAMMWNVLFSWMTSSSLAYIYGRDESFHEEFMSVNGREFPSKVVLPDGCSSEIKKTLAGCISRALPGLIADLQLPTPVSTLEQGLACLLDTMSFMDALPPFRMRQWQLIALLFIDALSVSKIPGLAPHLTSQKVLVSRVLNSAQVSAEEYEIMKDMVIPLGRVPQFSMQNGG